MSKLTPLDLVREFHTVYQQPIGVPHYFQEEWSDANVKLLTLREKLIQEEYLELTSAMNMENVVKELADLVYVVYGYAVTYGIDLDEAVRRVHSSNMSKLDDNGQPIYREDGKVLKGPNYFEPDMKGTY